MNNSTEKENAINGFILPLDAKLLFHGITINVPKGWKTVIGVRKKKKS